MYTFYDLLHSIQHTQQYHFQMTECYIIMAFKVQNHHNAQSTIMYKMTTVYYIPPNDDNVLYV